MTSLTTLPLISRLSNRVIRILGCNPGPMTLQGTNTYLVGTGIKRVLIDSGDAETGDEYTSLLSDVLKEENATIEHLIVTHWHHDHIGGVNAVQNLLKSTNVNSSPATVWKLPRSEGDPGGDEEEKSVGAWSHLNDDQLFEIEGAKLRIKHTPGHTTDHACLVLEDENAVFSGDCILGETSAVFENLHDYLISLTKILRQNANLIYPGHGPIVRNPNVKIQSYIEHRKKREDQIVEFLRVRKDQGACEVWDIVESMYKDTPKDLWPAAASNVNHHLEKLLKESRVRREHDKWLI